MKKHSPGFAAAVCGIVALLSLWNVGTAWKQKGAGDVYGVIAQQTRLQELIFSLPAVNVVGYFTEASPELGTDVNKLLGAEYAFAPRILVRQSQFPQQWVVGDFSQRVDVAAFARMNGFEVVREFDDGIVLFQRNGSP